MTLVALASGLTVETASGAVPGVRPWNRSTQESGEARDERPDSARILLRARAEQARFERERLGLLPRAWERYGGGCDESVGRLCTWYEEGEWVPEPEDPRISASRNALVLTLDSVARLLPGDPWILGQRVWYRAEAGRWEAALRDARACGGVDPWWCSALEGFALHGLGRYLESAAAFARALDTMEPERARRWRVPQRAVDGDAREALRERLDAAPSDGIGRALERLWTLADPLYLVDGNDRKTAHYARWTVAELRSRARNPFQLTWADDLEELTVRHGWEIGWERGVDWDPTSRGSIVGHKHPEGRDYMPPGSALLDPTSASEEDLRADRTRPRSLYAPAYAPVLLPVEGQWARFPRGEGFALVATYRLPEDTTLHADHAHPVPWMEPGEQAGRPDRAGLFLVPVGGEGDTAVARASSLSGGLAVEADAGAYLASVEVWSPPARRAGRARRGVAYEALPPDVPTLSDLLLVPAGIDVPATLEEAAASALLEPRVAEGRGFGIVWEVGGLGVDAETLGYRVSVRREGAGLLRKAGRFFGLVGDGEAVRVEWEEPGPPGPRHVLRHLDLDVRSLEAGTYRVRLEIVLAGRNPLVSERSVEVT